jgi:hypothetical protein
VRCVSYSALPPATTRAAGLLARSISTTFVGVRPSEALVPLVVVRDLESRCCNAATRSLSVGCRCCNAATRALSVGCSVSGSPASMRAGSSCRQSRRLVMSQLSAPPSGGLTTTPSAPGMTLNRLGCAKVPRIGNTAPSSSDAMPMGSKRFALQGIEYAFL